MLEYENFGLATGCVQAGVIVDRKVEVGRSLNVVRRFF